jgi:exonuclease III
VLLNCHGAEGKLDTMRHLCRKENADFLLLTETWAHSDNSLPELTGFEQWSTARPKARNKRGKHAGGVAVYVRHYLAKQMNVVSTVAKDDKIWVKLHKSVGLSEDLSICLIYLPPESDQHSRAHITKIYTSLTEEIRLARRSGSVLLAGDLNARTGALQEAAVLVDGLPSHIQPETEFLLRRASMDVLKRPNSSGKSLIELCDATDMIIANGRTTKDSIGSYTHQSKTTGNDGLGGQSLVDYFVADRAFFQERVRELSVSEIINSDHSSLTLDIGLDCDRGLQAGRQQELPSAAPQRFKITDDRHDMFVDLITNDPRLDCQSLTNTPDALHAAVQVQKAILDGATECFGGSPQIQKQLSPQTGGMIKSARNCKKSLWAW